MSLSRLTTAIIDGALRLPEGTVSIMRPPSDFDVSEIPRDDIRIAQGYYPDFAAWSDAGYTVTPRPEAAKITIVIVPKSKALAQSMIGQAAAWSDLVIVDGLKTNGVDSLFKSCRKKLGALPTITKGHGRIFWFDGAGQFSDWIAGPPTAGPDDFITTPGVFSHDKVDNGSKLLADALPPKLPKRMADVGAGWGYLANAILERETVVSLDLIEAEALALDCARLNVTDTRANFHWADATRFVPPVLFDGIVMNPPFHTGRAAEPQIGQAFIAQAAKMLTPQGKLWMVANRHLPYEQNLRDVFRNVEEIAGNGAFKVFHANRPLRHKG